MRITPLAAVFAGFLSIAGVAAAGYAPLRGTIVVRSLPPPAGGQDNRIGTNVPDVTASGNAVPIFVDAMKQALPWSSPQRLLLDRDGNVVALQRGQFAETTIYRGSLYPSGVYTLLYEGSGTFEVSPFSGAVLQRSPGRVTIAVRANPATGIKLRLVQVTPTNAPRNIRLVLPGFEATYSRHPFNPAFVQMLRQYHVIRFANWMHANTFAESAAWQTRTTTQSFSQGGDAGVAIEYMIDLANETGTDPWFALPPGATDYWVKNFAVMVAQHLDPRLHPLIEYGDEVWRAGTPANGWMWMAARNYRLRSDVDWYTKRSSIIFALVRQAYGGAPGRFVRVLSGPMPARTGTALAVDANMLSEADSLHEIDAFAIPGADSGMPGTMYAQTIADANALAQAHRLSLLAYDGSPNPRAPFLLSSQLETWHADGGKLFVAPPVFATEDAPLRSALLQYSLRHPAIRVIPGQFPLLLTPPAAGEARAPVRPAAPPMLPRRSSSTVGRAAAIATTPFDINAGGPNIGNYSADTGFAGGNVSTPTTVAIDTSGVSNPAPMNAYQSARIDIFSYTYSGLQPSSAYTLRLHFAEFVFNSAGKRLFNVSINGTQVLTSFDIFAAAGGEFKAVAQSFAVTSDANGQIVVNFTSVPGSTSPQVNALELIAGAGVPTPTPSPTPTPPPLTITGTIVSVATGRFEIQGPPACGYAWVYYGYTTSFTPPGWQPYPGHSVTVAGTGNCVGTISASSVTDNGLATPTPAPTATPAPTPTPGPTPTPVPTPKPLVSGTITVLGTSRFQIQGPSSCGLVWVNYTASTVWSPPGAKPLVGENVSVGSGSGSCATSFNATSVTVNNATPTPPPNTAADMVTFHGDNTRSGWNRNETILNATNVASTNFGLLSTIDVDGEVLAQPLYVANYQMPSGGGVHNLLVVATEHDSVYAIDADTGATLWQSVLGVAQNSADVGCGDISPEYGVTGTPVIKRTGPGTATIYVIAATEPGALNFHSYLHALDLGTGLDVRVPVEIRPSALMTNGAKIKFDPRAQMERSSLFWANASIYAAFGSHCDSAGLTTSGWMLRYDSNLSLINQFNTSDDVAPSADQQLTSIWMSGYAGAVDGNGNIYAALGNGGFDANTGGKNYGESVIKLSPTLSPLSYFTPSDWATLNAGDIDMGSGGVMLLPGSSSDLIAMGKAGKIFLLNSGGLGGYTTTDSGALEVYQDTSGTSTTGEPGTWGGPALYQPAPSTTYIYYQLNHGPLEQFSFNGSAFSLAHTGAVQGGYGGTMPVVSSNGTNPGTAIVWMVGRGGNLTLQAYNADAVGAPLTSLPAGTWNTKRGNAFVSPLVANGKVYVGAAGTISVYGLIHAAGVRTGALAANVMPARINATIKRAPYVRTHVPPQVKISGIILARGATNLTLRRRDASKITVDITPAMRANRTGIMPLGGAVVLYGYRGTDGKPHITSIGHNSSVPADWDSDTGL